MILRILLPVLLLTPRLSAQVTLDVHVPADRLPAAEAGRVVVFLVGPDRELGKKEPVEWSAWHDPMPIVAKSVDRLGNGDHVLIDATADTFGDRLDALKPGKWSAQAYFDWHPQASGWQMEPGNLLTEPVTFEVKPATPTKVELRLSRVVKQRPFDRAGAVQVIVKSKLLSDFRHQDVYLRAGVALPLNYDPKKRYAAIYEAPGFGGDDFDALDEAADREKLANKPGDAQSLAQTMFRIFLDPESPNGHTLFADSDVNGPCGRALVEELIPAIEAKFPALVAEPAARLLTGHSSGGYSVCWLQTHYDAFFGGAWPSSPDPIDFRAFELVDLYADANLYTRGNVEFPSVRDAKGKTLMTTRVENAIEQVIGPDNTGGQQWQSWEAVFGLPRGDGHPKSLYDITTGEIDKSQLDHYRRYDLAALLRSDPKTYAPIWRNKIRLVVGGADDFFLNEAVAKFKADLDALPPTEGPNEGSNEGYITIVPGKGHGSIYDTAEMKAFDGQMLRAIAPVLARFDKTP